MPKLSSVSTGKEATFEFLTTVMMKITLFWVVAPYSLVDIVTNVLMGPTPSILRVEEHVEDEKNYCYIKGG